jgi:hypothetical protein
MNNYSYLLQLDNCTNNACSAVYISLYVTPFVEKDLSLYIRYVVSLHILVHNFQSGTIIFALLPFQGDRFYTYISYTSPRYEERGIVLLSDTHLSLVFELKRICDFPTVVFPSVTDVPVFHESILVCVVCSHVLKHITIVYCR